MLSVLHVEADVFTASLAQAHAYAPASAAVAGVVPHHLMAAPLIAGLLRSVQDCGCDTVVILAPNHFSRHGKLVSTLLGWRWQGDAVACDASVWPALPKGDAFLEDATVENDHSASNLIPYIHEYLPHAAVAPVLLQNTMTSRDCAALAGALHTLAAKRRIFVLCSIDFSHYLTPAEAVRQDARTQAAIESADVTDILQMTSNNLDCPPALATFLLYSAQCGARVHILENTNSAQLTGAPQTSTTSYFILRAEP